MEGIIINSLDYPILTVSIFLPLAGALIILFLGRGALIKWLALAITVATFIITLPIYKYFDKTTYKMQFVEIHSWIPAWNINYKIGVDGISVLFIILVTILSILCVSVSWKAIQTKTKEFYISLLIMETAMIGIFVSLNVFLFYIFWELTLIPMFLLIGVWGGSQRIYAAVKFVLFMLAGSVLMLVGIIVLYYAGGRTFDIIELAKVNYPTGLQIWLFLAFFAAFAVKMPMFPIHTWLPDAHVEAPTAGSVILAAILLKMAGYGFIRFSIGLFPVASDFFTPLIFLLSIIAIVYTSLVALMQEDMKKLIAYSSVAHMGFVTVGIFTFTKQGLEGSIIQMISHGLISAALFLCVGVVYDRVHSRMISSYGGLVHIIPKYAVIFMIFTLAALGLPGTSGFVGEILILIGAFQKNILVAVLASLGVIFSAAYMLWLYKRVVFGKINNNELKKIYDLNKTEIFILSSLAFLILFFGFYPDPLFRTIDISVSELIKNYEMNLTFYLTEAAK